MADDLQIACGEEGQQLYEEIERFKPNEALLSDEIFLSVMKDISRRAEACLMRNGVSLPRGIDPSKKLLPKKGRVRFIS